MRKPLIWSIHCLLACTLTVSTALAVPRVMLVESFTNVGCPPCPEANAATHEFMTAYAPAMAVGVSYHVFWPDASDPFYLATSADALGRRSYYGVNMVPSLYSDGISTVTASVAALETMAGTRLTLDSPFSLVVGMTVEDGLISVDVDVTAEGEVPDGTLALRIALVETEIFFETPPGSNGETDFYDTMRDMLPGHAGTPLTISQGQTLSFSESTPVDLTWNLDNMRAVVWVQNDSTKEVLQAGSSAVIPTYVHFYGASEKLDVVDLGTLRTFETYLTNYGSVSDTYDIHVTPSLPVGWGGSICIGAVCYPPWILDFTATVAPGARQLVRVDIQPLVTAGVGTMTVTTTSRADPADTWTRAVKLISGIPVLSVDNDGGYTYETYFSAALDASGRAYAAWDRIVDGEISAAQLGHFDIVVWNAGFAYPPFSADDRTAMGAYLDGGGRLFLSGQDVGWAMCDAMSPFAGPETIAGYNTYLGADYLSDDSGDLIVTGLDGDPIGDELSFKLMGGTGADNQISPDLVAAREGAAGFVLYSADEVAAVHYESGAFRVVYLAYGFEGQDSESSRFTLMDRSLDWLAAPSVAVPEDGSGGRPWITKPLAAPNPGRHGTTIAFTVGGSAPAPVRVAVFDVLGRLVRTLWDGPAAPGACSLVWDGRNDAGMRVAAGTYMARVQVAEQVSTVKLGLMK